MGVGPQTESVLYGCQAQLPGWWARRVPCLLDPLFAHLRNGVEPPPGLIPSLCVLPKPSPLVPFVLTVCGPGTQTFTHHSSSVEPALCPRCGQSPTSVSLLHP